MRVLVLVVSLALAACTSAGDATLSTDDGGVDLGGCSTSCDCDPGQSCASGVCMTGAVHVYCCSSEGSQCPMGAICQAPNGEISRCAK